MRVAEFDGIGGAVEPGDEAAGETIAGKDVYPERLSVAPRNPGRSGRKNKLLPSGWLVFNLFGYEPDTSADDDDF
jgi:hypothetical protein